jgi:hypothetical protein
MAGCLKALGFWRKKSRADAACSTDEKYPAPHRGRTRTVAPDPPDPEKPPLEVHHAPVAFPSTGVPIRPHVNPVYSAYSTPADTRWTDSATATKTPYSLGGGAGMKDEGVDDPEEVARRKKAAQEEQERLDFFQML